MEFDKTDIQQKIVDIIASKLNIDKAIVLPGTTFQELGADSLDIVELIMQFEDSFGIEINDEDAERLNTLVDLVDYIYGLRCKK